MNPVLIMLTAIGAILLWLLCSFLYKPIGRLFARLIKDAEEAMFEDSKKDNKKED